jgi:hypothetical protein
MKTAYGPPAMGKNTSTGNLKRLFSRHELYFNYFRVLDIEKAPFILFNR